MHNTTQAANNGTIESQLFTDSGHSATDLQRLLKQAINSKVDIADIYAQSSVYQSLSLEDGIIKSASYSRDVGAGCRIVLQDKVGFATLSGGLQLNGIANTLTQASAIKNYGPATSKTIHNVATDPSKNTLPQNVVYAGINPTFTTNRNAQIALLNHIDLLARKNPLISKVSASIATSYNLIAIITPEAIHYDARPMSRINISVLANKNDKKTLGTSGGGGRQDCSMFNELWLTEQVNAAVDKAIINLDAKPAPAGNMPVVLGNGWTGVLLHEAVGHGLEADFNRKGLSVYSGMLGKPIASKLCTVVDNGTLADKRGSLNIDDEGTPSGCNLLIENGTLTGYMQDRQNALLMNSRPTGNGRRQSYSYLPMPRMTNTYLQAGTSSQQDMIQSVDNGILALDFSGGQVDITSGQFVFSMNLAYRIEKGKITHPVQGATLIGKGKDVMTNISMVGNDLAFDTGVGVCGKEGQSVPVGVGQPSVKLDSIVVGGTSTA